MSTLTPTQPLNVVASSPWLPNVRHLVTLLGQWMATRSLAMGLSPTLSWANMADDNLAETSAPISLRLAVANVLSPISSGKPYNKNQVEQELMALGTACIEAIVPYLTHPNDDVKALASMVLVRFGQQAIPAVQRFYQQAQTLPAHAPERWVAHQLMHLLCVQPEAALADKPRPVLSQTVPA